MLIIDGITFSQFGEGDFIQIAERGNEAIPVIGADGVSYNFTKSQGGEIIIGLMPVSKPKASFLGMSFLSAAVADKTCLDELYLLRYYQGVSQIKYFNMLFMSGVNEVFSALGCSFGELPSYSTGGTVLSAREFRINYTTLNMELGSGQIEQGLLGGLLPI